MNLRNFWTYFILLALTQLRCQAQPVQRATIRQISTIEDVRVSIDPLSLDELSNFQLDFKLSSNIRRIRLDLRPSQTNMNHVAEFLCVGLDGTGDFQSRLERSPPLLDEDARFYEGEALIFDPIRRSWRKAGGGRIVIGPFGPFLFEGVFSLDGNTHHVLLSFNYRNLRRLGDASLPSSGSTHMVVWKETDVI